MTSHDDAAITAAATAMRRSQCHACAADLRPCDCTPDKYDLEQARIALAAARPYLAVEAAAAERERIRQLLRDTPKPMWGPGPDVVAWVNDLLVVAWVNDLLRAARPPSKGDT